MCKSEIFAEILNIVGKETEVSTELILSSSKVTEVVDARSIVVFFLTEYGLYPEQIATLLHKTSASIQPETVTVPYSPIAAVPNCVAYQYGLYGGFNPYAAGNGFWG